METHRMETHRCGALCAEIRSLASALGVTLKVFDLQDFGDRYTVIYDDGSPKVEYLGASAHPCHPLGIGQHGELSRDLVGAHLGQQIDLETLPAEVLLVVAQDLQPANRVETRQSCQS